MGSHLTVEAVSAILIVVTAITEIVKKYAIPPDYAPLVAAAISLIVMAAWAVTFEASFDRTMLWPYLTGFISVWTGAMGTHSVITHVTSKMASDKAIRRAEAANATRMVNDETNSPS